MVRLTVFYDGACPLCVREIGLLRRLDKRDRIQFTDISPPEADEFCPLDRQKMLARFHAQKQDGTIVDGAEAFTEAYAQVPWLGWIAPIGRFPPTRWMINMAYAVFLKLRPTLQWAVKRAGG